MKSLSLPIFISVNIPPCTSEINQFVAVGLDTEQRVITLEIWQYGCSKSSAKNSLSEVPREIKRAR